MSLSVRIMVDSQADPQETEAAKNVLEGFGLAVELDRSVYIRKSAQEYLPWLYILYMEFQPFTKSYLEALGSQLGKDTGIWLKDLISRLAATRKDPKEVGGTVIIRDEQTGIEIWIPDGKLSEEAARAFPKIDLSCFKTGPVVWNEQEKDWKSSDSHGQAMGD